jgi:hypothetical protein
MAKTNNFKKAKKEVLLRKRGGIPVWLYITLSFLIPIYGLIYYLLLKDRDEKRAKIALFLASLGFAVWLFLKMIVWLR